MFKFNDKNTRAMLEFLFNKVASFWKRDSNVVLVFLLLTLNIFHFFSSVSMLILDKYILDKYWEV